MSYENVKQSRTNTKEKIVYVMGGCCQLCGYNKAITALELHHLQPLEKELTISHNTNLAWAKIREELPKCILVCANCHREIHANISIAPIYSSFNEEYAKEVDVLLLQLKHKKICYCKNCGDIIESNAATYCIKCSGIMRRIVQRPEKQQLKTEIRQETFTSIGKKYSVSDNAIRKWCISYNLPSTKKEINAYSDAEWEKV
jgi:hypothetical protein